MPALKFQIKRKCEMCGATFIAKTLESKYCSKHCIDMAYKQKKAAAKKAEQFKQIAQKVPDAREYISVAEAVAMYSIGRDTIYRLIKKGAIPYINIGERLTRIKRTELEKMFPKREEPIEKDKPLPRLYSLEPEDCYTIGEISKKYRIDDSTVWAHIRKYSIPTRQIGNYVYAPKRKSTNFIRAYEEAISTYESYG